MSSPRSRDAQTGIAAAAEPEERQPAEAPVDFETWAYPKRGTLWRTLLAGFTFACRQDGTLLEKHPPREWERRFQAWMERPA